MQQKTEELKQFQRARWIYKALHSYKVSISYDFQISFSLMFATLCEMGNGPIKIFLEDSCLNNFWLADQ